MSFVAAAIVGGTALVGGVVSASASSKAANKAAQVSQDATTQNNALARDIYSQNTQTLAPFVQQGGAATAYINQLLGIQSPQAAQPQPVTPGAASSAGSPSWNGGYLDSAQTRQDIGRDGYGFEDLKVSDGLGGLGRAMILGSFRQGGYQAPQQAAPVATYAPAAAAPAAGSAGNAFDAYRNSTGYQFRLGEGMRAVTANKAMSGLLNSGSAVKSAMRYGDGLAAAEFDNYYNRLAGQQGVGLSAASAQAGVANNYSSQVQGNNSTNATNAGNAAIAKGNAISNAANGVSNSLAYIYGARG